MVERVAAVQAYVARATPWRDLCAGVVVLVPVLVLIARWPRLWPGLAVAVGLLVACGALSMDEPAAAVVDAAPRNLRWRTATRSLPLLPLAGVWVVFAWYVGSPARPGPASGHRAVAVLLGLGALVAGAAVATVLRRCGQATPGAAIAGVLGVGVMMLDVGLRYLFRQPIVLPSVGAHDWRRALGFWAVVAVASLIAVVVATDASARHRRAWRTRRR